MDLMTLAFHTDESLKTHMLTVPRERQRCGIPDQQLVSGGPTAARDM